MKLLYSSYHENRVNFWNRNWKRRKEKFGPGRYYHNRLLRIYQSIIDENSSVLELGCGNGKLIGRLKNHEKVGIDFSHDAIEFSTTTYNDTEFIESDIYDFQINRKFDYIILSDFLGDLWDIELVFKKIQDFSHPGTRVIINYYSKLWEFPLRIAQFMRLKNPNLEQNWITTNDLKNLFYLSDFELIKKWEEILFPINIPVITWFFNRFIAKLPFFRIFALTNFAVARLKPDNNLKNEPSVSVIVAARNEAGHIPELIDRLPKLGRSTELVFVEGGSKDNTYEVIENEITLRPDMNIKLFKQEGVGKGDAVRMGFEKATGDILMILDADLTMPPEKLPLFYEAVKLGKGEFINGVRLVYPMTKKAMRFFNLIANKFFSVAFSWVLGQPVKDTLCGTKVLSKKHYEQICLNRKYFGNFDPFGDFDLLFGAAKLNLKIQDLPIRYMDRTYGETNISRWTHGVLLLRMLLFATFKIKFI